MMLIMLFATSGPGWQETVTAIGTGVIAFGVVIAIYQVREGRRERHASMAIHFIQRWSSEEFIETRRRVNAFQTRQELADAFLAASDSDSLDYYTFQRELDFFEDLSALQMQDGVSLFWIQRVFGNLINTRWQTWEQAVTDLREQADDKTIYENFERLAELVVLQSRWDRLRYRLARRLER